MSKLNQEKIEAIREIVNTDGAKSILILMDTLIDNMGREVLAVNTNEKSFSQLAITKSKYDGAKLLRDRLNSELHKIKGDSNE